MIKKFKLSFDSLGIVPEDLSELLGFYIGEIPEPFPEMIEIALKNAPDYCHIQGGYQIFDSLRIDLDNEILHVNHQVFSPSKIVVTQLKKATSCALFVCTAGKEITEYAKKLEGEGEIMLSYVFDVLGSVIVDKAMDMIQTNLEMELQQKGLKISDRFSPGYCEWSVAEQQKLFSLLPAGFCGITLSKSSLMTPIKSVSGIIGIGKELEQKGYQCHWCSDRNCMYGKIKRQKKD